MKNPLVLAAILVLVVGVGGALFKTGTENRTSFQEPAEAQLILGENPIIGTEDGTPTPSNRQQTTAKKLVVHRSDSKADQDLQQPSDSQKAHAETDAIARAAVEVTLVEEASGKHLNDVSVWLRPQTGAILKGRTNSKGTVSFPSVPLGSYEATAKMPRAKVEVLSNITFEEPGDHEVILTYPALPQVRLQLLDSKERPLSDIPLLVGFMPGPKPISRETLIEGFYVNVRTDGQGLVEVPSPVGMHAIIVYPETDLLLSLSPKRRWGGSLALQIASQDETKKIYGNLEMREVEVIIRGLGKEAGAPELYAELLGIGDDKQLITPKDHRFLFTGAPGQEFGVSVGRVMGGKKVKDHYIESQIHEDESKNRVVFNYGASYDIEGSVKLPDGTPVSMVRLQISGVDASGISDESVLTTQQETEPTNVYGAFSVQLREAPLYQFQISRSSMEALPFGYHQELPAIVSWDVLMGEEPVSIVLDPAPRLRGYVHGVEQQPEAFATVSALDWRLETISSAVQTDESGAFDLSIWDTLTSQSEHDLENLEVFLVVNSRHGDFGLTKVSNPPQEDIHILLYPTVDIEVVIESKEKNLAYLWEFTEGKRTLWRGTSFELLRFGILAEENSHGLISAQKIPLKLARLSIFDIESKEVAPVETVQISSSRIELHVP